MRVDEIITKNKSIDTFMKNGVTVYNGYSKEYADSLMFSAGYDNDWRKLMSVVNRIESKKYVCVIYSNYCCIQDSESFKSNTDNKKYPVFYAEYYESDKFRAVYNTVFEFTKWYNEADR